MLPPYATTTHAPSPTHPSFPPAAGRSRGSFLLTQARDPDKVLALMDSAFFESQLPLSAGSARSPSGASPPASTGMLPLGPLSSWDSFVGDLHAAGNAEPRQLRGGGSQGGPHPPLASMLCTSRLSHPRLDRVAEGRTGCSSVTSMSQVIVDGICTDVGEVHIGSTRGASGNGGGEEREYLTTPDEAVVWHEVTVRRFLDAELQGWVPRVQ